MTETIDLNHEEGVVIEVPKQFAWLLKLSAADAINQLADYVDEIVKDSEKVNSEDEWYEALSCLNALRKHFGMSDLDYQNLVSTILAGLAGRKRVVF